MLRTRTAAGARWRTSKDVAGHVQGESDENRETAREKSGTIVCAAVGQTGHQRELEARTGWAVTQVCRTHLHSVTYYLLRFSFE